MAPGLTLLVMAGAAVLFALMQKYVKDPREIGRNILKLNNSLYYELTEHLNGIKEIKSYGVEAVQVENFSRVRRLMKKNMVDFNLIQTRTGLFYKVGAAVFISLFLYSAIDIFRLNPQEFIIITVIAARLWPRLSSFQQGLQNINMVLPSFQSVKELEEQCLAAGENLRGVMTIVVYRPPHIHHQERRPHPRAGAGANRGDRRLPVPAQNRRPLPVFSRPIQRYVGAASAAQGDSGDGSQLSQKMAG